MLFLILFTYLSVGFVVSLGIKMADRDGNISTNRLMAWFVFWPLLLILGAIKGLRE